MAIERRSGGERRMDAESVERLNRIEGKLDKVSEAIVSLARMEERMVTLFKRMDTYDQQQMEIIKRVSTVEVTQAGANGSNKWVDRVIWFIIAGGLGLILMAAKAGV